MVEGRHPSRQGARALSTTHYEGRVNAMMAQALLLMELSNAYFAAYTGSHELSPLVDTYHFFVLHAL